MIRFRSKQAFDRVTPLLFLTSFAASNAASLSSGGASAKYRSSIKSATPCSTPPPEQRKPCGLSPFPPGSASPSAVKKAASCERRVTSLTPSTNTLSPSSDPPSSSRRHQVRDPHEQKNRTILSFSCTCLKQFCPVLPKIQFLNVSNLLFCRRGSSASCGVQPDQASTAHARNAAPTATWQHPIAKHITWTRHQRRLYVAPSSRGTYYPLEINWV